MDRNNRQLRTRTRANVALRKESVDRNIASGQLPATQPPSLSARRAWIEMRPRWYPVWEATSLSARRAWIEILIVVLLCHHISVALRKESVDRNPAPAVQGVIAGVALRKESVDRNLRRNSASGRQYRSLSARRAWNVSLSDCSGGGACGYPL